MSANVAFAGDIRAGNMRVEQLSQQTVKVTVNLYTHLHASPVAMELCWGDGNCEQWSSSLIEEWPEIDTRHYQMHTFHNYEQEGQYELTVKSCCWAGDLINLSASEENEFSLKTIFTFSKEQDWQNTLPSIDPFFTICPLTACAYTPQTNDAEGDSLVWDLCLPDLVGYFPLEEIAPSPSNIVTFDQQLGALSWVSPPFEGFYSHVTCLSEYRSGQLISESEYFTLVVVNNSLPTQQILLPNFTLNPNPAHNLLHLDGIDEEWQQGKCMIYNAWGQQIYMQHGTLPIPTTSWPTGVYYLVLQLDHNRVIRTFYK